MNYATTSHIGKNKPARRKKTKNAPQTISQVFGVVGPAQRYRRNKKGQTEIRANKGTTYAFLNSTFLPKFRENPHFKPAENAEEEFYESLSELAEHYRIEPKPTQRFTFPYSALLALEDIQKNVGNVAEVRICREENKIFLRTEERYNTGATLFYIPIVPLYKICKDPKRKKSAVLLKSVSAYLLHSAKIGYYRNSDTYLYWMYEMVGEWLISDEENEEAETYRTEIRRAEQIGDLMQGKIFNLQNLRRFGERLEHFTIRNEFDQKCYCLARKAFELSNDYPNENIDRNTAVFGQNCEEDGDYGENSTVKIDQYVSFCADTEGLLFQSLFESINLEFSEYCHTEEPTIVKKFNGDGADKGSLDFKRRIFPIIEELIDILK